MAVDSLVSLVNLVSLVKSVGQTDPPDPPDLSDQTAICANPHKIRANLRRRHSPATRYAKA